MTEPSLHEPETDSRTVTLAASFGANAAPVDPVDRARALRTDRLRRKAIFGLTLGVLHEPAWDIMLDLFIAEGERRAPDFATLCANADIHGPTALRWITTLEQLGLVRALADPAAAVPTLRLSVSGRTAMKNYLSGA